MHLLLPALLAAAAAAAPDLYDARLRLKVLNSRLQGPGEHLLHGLHQGDVVARESFATQFVLDIARVTGVHPDRVYVDGLAAPGVHYSWPGAATEVSFRVLNATHGGGPPTNEAVRNLTALVHTRGSALYAHPVTGGVDHTYGLVAVDWDASLRLWATLDVLGGPNTTATAWGDAYVDLGGSRGCRAVPAARGYLQGPDVGLSVDNSYVYRGQDPGQDASAYCEFEAYFRDDVARAAQVSARSPRCPTPPQPTDPPYHRSPASASKFSSSRRLPWTKHWCTSACTPTRPAAAGRPPTPSSTCGTRRRRERPPWPRSAT